MTEAFVRELGEQLPDLLGVSVEIERTVLGMGGALKEAWVVDDGIAYGRELLRDELVEAARQVAREQLTASTDGVGHYCGVGFLGIHDGRGETLVFVDYWANENELNHHVYVSPSEDPTSLEYVTLPGLIACAWDLRILSFERGAWVEAVLAKHAGPDVGAYLARTLNEDA